MTIKPHHTLEQLKTLYRSEMNARLARRIQGVYLAKKGMTCPEIMLITGAKRRTVQQWIAKYNRGGIDELIDKPRPGQPPKLPKSQQADLCRRIEAGPTDSDGVSVLNGPAIRRILEHEFGVIYSKPGLYDFLHRLGYECLCPRPRHEKADPEAQKEFKKTSLKCWMKSPRTIQENE